MVKDVLDNAIIKLNKMIKLIVTYTQLWEMFEIKFSKNDYETDIKVIIADWGYQTIKWRCDTFTTYI